MSYLKTYLKYYGFEVKEVLMFPVFPLNIVVLPQESVALHLFEPRYKQLYADCKNGGEFVILYTDKNGLANYGTIVTIQKTTNLFPDDTVDIIIEGVRIVKVTKFHKLYPTKLYSAVEAEEINIESNASEKLNDQFKTYLSALKKTVKKSEPYSLYYIANRMKLPVETKMDIISIENTSKLDLFLINELRFQQNIREQEDQLNHKFHLN